MWSSSEAAYRSARRIAFAILIGGLAITFLLRLADAASKKDPRELSEEAKARAAEVEIRVEPPQYPDRKRVEEIGRTGMERGKAAMEERRRAMEQKETPADKPASGEEPSVEPASRPAVPGRVVVALSSSMPEAMLREYLRQLDGIPEGIVVLRGFIGGARTVAPTGAWIKKLLRTQIDCQPCEYRAVQVVVDPLTYRMLGIDKVPAVAYLPGVQELKHCDAEILKATHLVYGATSISAALQRLSSQGVEVPAELLKRFGSRT